MTSRWSCLLLLGFFFPWGLAGTSRAEEPKSPAKAESPAKTDKPAEKASSKSTKKANPPAENRFMRVTRNEKKQIETLETSIVRYVSKDSLPADAIPVDPRVNEKTADGQTPLHLAAGKGHIDVVKLLLSKGAQPDARSNQGQTPLHLAAEGGHKEIIELLLAAGKSKPALTVDLIGAVHIGDKTYYESLNKAFAGYDAMLYELVAPTGTRVPKNQPSGGRNPLAMLQSGMGNMLELDYQLSNIDYHQSNFVHADMTPEQVSKSMKDKGESIMQMMFKSMGQSMAQQASGKGPNDAALMMALMSKDRATALKRLFAQQFEDMEGQMDFLGGADGSTIITERNKVALKVLAEQIKQGKKNLAIFYGAGHMADMEKRLLEEFGLVRADSPQWLVAWDLRNKAKPAGDKPAAKPAEKTTDKGAEKAETPAPVTVKP